MGDKENEKLQKQKQRMLERLKSARMDAGFDQRAVAPLIGVSIATLSRWECGINQIKDIDVIIKLAQLYHVNAGWLWGLDLPRQDPTEEQIELMKEIDDILVFASAEQLRKVKVFIDNFIEIDKEEI